MFMKTPLPHKHFRGIWGNTFNFTFLVAFYMFIFDVTLMSFSPFTPLRNNLNLKSRQSLINEKEARNTVLLGEEGRVKIMFSEHVARGAELNFIITSWSLLSSILLPNWIWNIKVAADFPFHSFPKLAPPFRKRDMLTFISNIDHLKVEAQSIDM